jgi:hypothetical protein
MTRQTAARTRGAKWIAVLALALSTVAANADVSSLGDDQWHAFDVDDLSTNSSGPEWISLDGSALSFSVTLATPAYLTVLDGGLGLFTRRGSR